MSVNEDIRSRSYAGNGSTTVFEAFYVVDVSTIKVQLTDANGNTTPWYSGTQYTIQGTFPGNATIVVKTTPTDYTPALNTTLTIFRDGAILQPTEFASSGPFPVEAVTTSLDRVTCFLQQNAALLDSSIKLPFQDQYNTTLPGPAQRINTVLAFDSNGAPTVTRLVDLESVSYTELVDDITDDAVAEILDTLAFPTIEAGDVGKVLSVSAGLEYEHKELPATPTATDIVYDNATSGLAATTTQAAIDEVTGLIGGMTLIASTTASNATTIDFTNAVAFDGTYKGLLFVFEEIFPAVNNADLRCVFSQAASWVVAAGSYTYANFGAVTTTAASPGGSVGDTSIGMAGPVNQNMGIVAGDALTGRATIYRMNETGGRKTIEWSVIYNDGAGDRIGVRNGAGRILTNADPIDGVRFFLSNGNIASGTIHMYGLK
jgi:hypothetical protein